MVLRGNKKVIFGFMPGEIHQEDDKLAGIGK